jgi:hypothetical protein
VQRLDNVPVAQLVPDGAPRAAARTVRRGGTCGRIAVMSAAQDARLDAAVAEIETHVAAAGWDRRPVLFALVRAGRLRAEDPATARRAGIADVPEDMLAPVEQETLPEGPLDEALAHIEWPDSVTGCALSQEIVMLPPPAEADVGGDAATAGDDADAAGRSDVGTPDAAARHPQRREARLVVGVVRDGAAASVLRLRSTGDGPDSELLIGPDLAPNLAEALLATLIPTPAP